MARTISRPRPYRCNCKSGSPPDSPADSPPDPPPDSSPDPPRHSFLISPPNSPAPPPLSFAPASPSREFLCFPHLPLELRVEIWQHALPPPRTFRVIRDSNSDDSDYDTETSSETCVSGFDDGIDRRLPTSLLHVCRESRAIALRSYELAYEPARRRLYSYIDIARDSIFLGNRYRGTTLSWRVRSRIRWLEMSGREFDRLWPSIRDEFIAEILTGFPAAHELRIWENHSSTCGRFEFSLSETAAIEMKFDEVRAKRGWSPLKIVLVPDESRVFDARTFDSLLNNKVRQATGSQ